MMSTDEEEIPASWFGQRINQENLDLYDSAKKGNLSGVEDALDRGAHPDFFQKCVEGTPAPLHAAVWSGEETGLSCTEALIQKGANVNTTLISNSNTPLHEAAAIGSKDICQVLLTHRASMHRNAFGNTPLHTAARNGSVEVVRLLLEKGAEVNSANNRGSTALHLCCFLTPTSEKDSNSSVKEYLEIASILLNAGVDVDKFDENGYTALHIAAQRGCIDMAKLLVDNGASLTCKTFINNKGKGGRTPAQMAKFGGMSVTEEFLLKAAQEKINE